MTAVPLWMAICFTALCLTGTIAGLIDMNNSRTEIGVLVHLACIMFYIVIVTFAWHLVPFA